MIKRYWLFAYRDYYPSGGMNDLDSMHDTIEEAKKMASYRERHSADWYDILDATTATIVSEGEYKKKDHIVWNDEKRKVYP